MGTAAYPNDVDVARPALRWRGFDLVRRQGFEPRTR
jgi:hypothetical protein